MTINDPNFLDILDSLFARAGIFNQPKENRAYAYQKQPASGKQEDNIIFPTIPFIPISRVIYSGNTTIVYFSDKTYAIVNCSPHDNYDRQTAIAYAILKRIFGKVGKYDKKTKKFNAYEIDGDGLGLKLEKIANAGYDQDAEKKNLAAKKAEAKAKHIAKQKSEQDAAWWKRVQKRAEEIKLEREANALLDSLTKADNKKLILEDVNNKQTPAIRARDLPKGTARTSGLMQIDPKDAWKLYHKPDKPFSKFTDEEKREYWRYHNAKRRANSK